MARKQLTVNLFDTETTGLCVPKVNDLDKQPYMVEIYVMKVVQNGNKFEQVGEFDILLKPPIELSAKITKITGITNTAIKGKNPFVKEYKRIAEFFTGVDRMVAHNMTFDRNILLYELARIDKQLNFPWPIQHICTVEKSMSIEQRRMSLKNLHKELVGYEFEDAHRAKNDVEALFRVYEQMVTKGMIL